MVMRTRLNVTFMYIAYLVNLYTFTFNMQKNPIFFGQHSALCVLRDYRTKGDYLRT